MESRHKLDYSKYVDTVEDLIEDIQDELYYQPDYEDIIKEGLQLIIKKIKDSKKLK